MIKNESISTVHFELPMNGLEAKIIFVKKIYMESDCVLPMDPDGPNVCSNKSQIKSYDQPMDVKEIKNDLVQVKLNDHFLPKHVIPVDKTHLSE